MPFMLQRNWSSSWGDVGNGNGSDHTTSLHGKLYAFLLSAGTQKGRQTCSLCSKHSLLVDMYGRLREKERKREKEGERDFGTFLASDTSTVVYPFTFQEILPTVSLVTLRIIPGN